jgi:hypothetical protein
MKTLFLGHFAAAVAPRILAKVEMHLESSTLDDEGDRGHLTPLLAEAEIVVGHIWRAVVSARAAPVAVGGGRTRSRRHRSGAEGGDDLQRAWIG